MMQGSREAKVKTPAGKSFRGIHPRKPGKPPLATTRREKRG